VVNGLAGHENAYFGFIPVGSGNDFVRNFDDPESFKDIGRQFAAASKPIDVLKFRYKKASAGNAASAAGSSISASGTAGVSDDDEYITRYYINGINIGFDGNTAILAHDLKNLPMVSGTFSYILALVNNLVKKKGENLRVTSDGQILHDGPLLLCTAANGGFCGGGFNSCPRAVLDDGLAELLIVNNITRRKFLSLVPDYKAGKLFEMKGTEGLIKYKQARNIKIEPLNGTMSFVADGEIFETGTIDIELVDKAIKVLIP